ncbi:MAG TPA: GNAT family N-acetyltransferase [Terriglobales bacterium]|nr:GNAT family N-acetyltransferase [Terriglobales bacterium]
MQRETTPDISIREATAGDIPDILRHRRGMYESMGYDDGNALAAMVSATEQYLPQAMSNGSFHAWLAVQGARVVGGGAVVIAAWPSHPYDLECRRATVLNVYVDPDFRRQGIARRLMQTMIEWCRKHGFAKVYLHASNSGRPLYESMGFEPTTEMQFTLR